MSLRKSYFCQHNKFTTFVRFFDRNPLWLVISDWRVDKAFLHFLKCSEDLSSHPGLCSSNVLSGRLWREGCGRIEPVLSGDHEPNAVPPHLSCKETLPAEAFRMAAAQGTPASLFRAQVDGMAQDLPIHHSVWVPSLWRLLLRRRGPGLGMVLQVQACFLSLSQPVCRPLSSALSGGARGQSWGRSCGFWITYPRSLNSPDPSSYTHYPQPIWLLSFV